MRNIGEIVQFNGLYYPDKKAIVEQEKKFTWKEVNERTDRLANSFVGLGCEKGDRIAILAYNSSEYVECIFATAKAGMVFVPLNYRLSLREIEFMLRDSTPKVLLYDKEFSNIADSLKPQFPLQYICIGQGAKGSIEYEALMESRSSSGASERGIAVDENSPSEILYTSGTTGLPKGVVHTHRARLAGVVTHVLYGGLRHDDTHLVNVPALFHGAGLVWMLANAYVGASIVVSRLRGFDPEALLTSIQNESVTNLHLVPRTMLELLEFPGVKKYDVSSLRLIYYATAPMPVNLLRRAINMFGNIFVQPYGLTEAGPTVTVLGREEHNVNGLSDEEANRRLRSCGKPFWGRFVKIVDDKGEEVPPHSVGEIIVKAADIMDGYWNNEEETRKVLKNGWLHTGDLATYDENRYLYLVDRKKDMIISGGENIYPAEIERVMWEHPAVAECAVIGVPDDRWGESVKALVVRRPGHQVSEEEIIQFCKKSLASYKKPKSVEFVSELPRNTQGKVLKRALRERYWANRDRRV
jgi:long-chain acyl-CoA synthetase